MERRYKLIIGAVSGAALIGAGVIFLPPLFQTKNSSDKMDVVTRAMVHSIGVTGITIRLDVQMKNPTKAAFKMKFPYFNLKWKGSDIGTSQSINQDIDVKPFDEAHFNNILFTVPLVKAFTTATALISAANKKEKVTMDMEVHTAIDPYWKYDEEKKMLVPKMNLGNAGVIEVPKNVPVDLLT